MTKKMMFLSLLRINQKGERKLFFALHWQEETQKTLNS